ncbi:MAG: hypothetical protein ABRQ38_24535 [Candidatus Eremiobacterota bacterium]
MYYVRNEKAIMLISVLILITILMMLVTSMLLIATQNYNMAGMADKKAKALRSAEAGIEYALYRLNNDTTWTPSVDLYVDMYFSQGEKAKIIASEFTNNLKGNTQTGSTPPYSAEVLSEGSYKGQKVKIKAIFVRDDMSQYPLASEGNLLLNYQEVNGEKKVTGKNNSPGRLHSNDRMIVWEPYYGGVSLDLNEGFLSSVGNLEYSKYNGGHPPFDYKEHVNPAEIANINIPVVVNKHSGYHTVAGDRYYLVGYFEYSPGNYCIPHEGPAAVTSRTSDTDYWDQTSDDMVYTHPYKYGIASFTESSCKNFMDKYRELQSIGPDIPTTIIDEKRNLNTSRNLFDYYTDVTFGEIYSTGWEDTMNTLGMTYSTELDGGIVVTTLQLKDNTYCSGALGLFETLRFDCYREGNGDIGDARLLSFVKPKLKLKLNNKNLYCEGEMSLPSIDNGTAASKDSIYILCDHGENMTVLAENNIIMCIKDPTPDVTGETITDITLSGLLYAKDNIYIGTLKWPQQDYNSSVVFKGSITAKEKDPNNNTYYPRTTNSDYGLSQSNIALAPALIDSITLIHASNGVQSLVAGRGNTFRIRKAVTMIVN